MLFYDLTIFSSLLLFVKSIRINILMSHRSFTNSCDVYLLRWTSNLFPPILIWWQALRLRFLLVKTTLLQLTKHTLSSCLIGWLILDLYLIRFSWHGQFLFLVNIWHFNDGTIVPTEWVYHLLLICKDAVTSHSFVVYVTPVLLQEVWRKLLVR